MRNADLLRAPFTRAAWQGRRVLILGLGQYPQGSGITAALLFARLGARVTVTDLKTRVELKANVARLKKFHHVRLVLGGHAERDIRAADIIIANPRVRPSSPELRLAKRLGIPVTSDVALFMNRCGARVIGVTGTRGKSTTSALVAHILRATGKTVWLGGNILVSPLTFLSRLKPWHLVVLELSSWQCESLVGSKAPHIAVITNLLRDHLNTYRGLADYAAAKAQIFKRQGADDIVILNGDDPYGRGWKKTAPGRVLTFGSGARNHAYLAMTTLMLRDRRHRMALLDEKSLPLLGRHNAMNSLAAALAAQAAGARSSEIRRGLRTFKPLPHRLELVRVIRGVKYVNDTTATTPDGTIAAVKALVGDHHHLWLIMGGADKKLDYQALARVIAERRPHVHVILMPGDASLKIAAVLLKRKIHFYPVSSLLDSINLAAEHAVTGDVVILSPGAASFNQFANEFERGEAFREMVVGLTVF